MNTSLSFNRIVKLLMLYSSAEEKSVIINKRMDKYDLPVADRYHELDDEVITVLNNLHHKADSHFERLEQEGQQPIRGILRTDIGDLNQAEGIRNLLEVEDSIDIHRLFNLDRRYRRKLGKAASEITLGLATRVDPETDREYLDIYATKTYPKESRLRKLGAFATNLAQRFMQRKHATREPSIAPSFS